MWWPGIADAQQKEGFKPMSKPPNDIRQWIQELISRSATDQLHDLQRFEDLLRRSLHGEIDQAKLRDEYLRFAQQESMRYINDLTRVGLSFYNTLVELNRHYNDRFYERVLQDTSVGSVPEAEKSGPRVVSMELHGPVGGEAVHSFMIENQRTEPMTVSFLVSEFSDEKGTTTFRPSLQLSPARFNLRPGEERRVNLRIPLLPEFFIADQVYTATIVVSGFEGLQLRLRAWADAVRESTTQAVLGQSTRPGPVFMPVEEAAEAASVDDLTRIKGIGFTYQRKLHDGGVRTFARLAECDDATLERLLGRNAAPRAQSGKWQAQARLAAEGAQAALDALQQELS